MNLSSIPNLVNFPRISTWVNSPNISKNVVHTTKNKEEDIINQQTEVNTVNKPESEVENMETKHDNTSPGKEVTQPGRCKYRRYGEDYDHEGHGHHKWHHHWHHRHHHFMIRKETLSRKELFQRELFRQFDPLFN